MKVLITGKSSYLGGNLKRKLDAGGHCCDTVSVREGLPDFFGYDAVVHTAAVVHDTGKAAAKAYHKKQRQDLYETVNTELTVKLAAKAKEQGVPHFVFISTMAVYGQKDCIGKPSVIDRHTPLNPTTAYGRSKLRAEKALAAMESPGFAVSVVRTPMVYGEGCPGNYARLERLARVARLFPDIKNERSVLHVERFCDCIEWILTKKAQGIFHPQDPAYICTSEWVAKMRETKGQKTTLIPGAGILLRLFPLGTLAKIFGNLTYDRALSQMMPPEVLSKHRNSISDQNNH